MANIRDHIVNHPHYDKAKRWGKLMTITGMGQAIVYGVSFISGLLIIRFLSESEYAYYTIANVMFGTLSAISDSGIGAGVMSIGGRIWKDREKLGSLMATGMRLRNRFALISLAVIVPIMAYLLWSHGASWLTIGLITFSLIPAFFSNLTESLLQIPLKLHQAILPMQKNQTAVSLGRLVLTALSVLAFPMAFVALLSSGIPRIIGNRRMRKLNEPYANIKNPPDRRYRKQILKVVQRMMPGTVYSCVSGQITIWLMAILGTTAAVAQIGALAKVSAGLGILGVVFAMLFQPSFAKIRKDKVRLAKRFNLMALGIILLSVIIVFSVSLLSDLILMVLGPEYIGLNYELTLSITGGCIALIASSLFGLSLSRGWPPHPVVLIATNLVFIIAGIFIFNVSTLIGVLKFNIFIAIAPVIVAFFTFYSKINRLR